MAKNIGKPIEAVMKEINKRFGAGSIRVLTKEELLPIPRISTGSLLFDMEMGGGYPMGRIIELFGSESCLDEDTYISYEIRKKSSGKRVNNKGGTIKRLYERFKDKLSNLDNRGQPAKRENLDFFIKSVNNEEFIISNKVVDVIKTGLKPCFLLETADGQSLISTKDHKYMTPTGFKRLEDLAIGEEVIIHNNTPNKGKKKIEYRPAKCIKYHSKGGIKIVHDSKTGNDYLYHRVQVSRLHYEAFMNQFTYKEYIHILNTESKAIIDTLKTLPDDVHVHHIDEDFTNNSISNLHLIDASAHGKLHMRDRLKNLSYITGVSKIVSITDVGKRETYDIKCQSPYNNYVANKIVVHNSGKTWTALVGATEAIKEGFKIVWIDLEGTLDPTLYKLFGVFTEENFIYCRPASGEEAFNIARELLRSDTLCYIVIDSIPSAILNSDITGDMGDKQVAGNASLVTKAWRNFLQVSNEKAERLNDRASIIIGINQERDAIGVTYGSKDTTPGGRGRKHWASVRIKVRRSGWIEEGAERNKIRIGQEVTVRTEKNKTFPPYRVAFFNIFFPPRSPLIDQLPELIIIGEKRGLIERGGSWFTYREYKFQGINKFIDALRQDKALVEQLAKEVYESCGWHDRFERKYPPKKVKATTEPTETLPVEVIKAKADIKKSPATKTKKVSNKKGK